MLGKGGVKAGLVVKSRWLRWLAPPVLLAHFVGDVLGAEGKQLSLTQFVMVSVWNNPKIAC